MLQVYKLPRPETQTVRMQHVAPPTQCTRGLDPHGCSLQVQNIKHKGDISSTIQETISDQGLHWHTNLMILLEGELSGQCGYAVQKEVHCDPPNNKRKG